MKAFRCRCCDLAEFSAPWGVSVRTTAILTRTTRIRR
nr:MAG TPA: hypothetical protein [Caudoviricetes sp.]